MTNIEEKITKLQKASKRLVTIEFDGSDFVIKDDEEVIAKDDSLIPALEAAIKYFANHLRVNIENVAADISKKEVELQHQKERLLALRELLERFA